MKVKEKPDLKGLNTFGVPAKAALRIDIETEEDLLSIPRFEPAHDLVLGGGSNVLLVSDVPQTLFLNQIRGRSVLECNGGLARIEAGAGENWHQLVLWTVELGLSGLENLSLIPGSVGAAPMQNIGAYGVELSSVLESVTAWDWERQQFRVFPTEECQFAYRDSRFKTRDRDSFLITSIRLSLSEEFNPKLDYPGLAEALSPVASPTLAQVSNAVISIRERKLPNPSRVGNAGSFFKNPVVSSETTNRLLKDYPGLPHWSIGGGNTKFSAAWMIERCGLKGYSIGGAAVSTQHALVLVNQGNATGREVLALSEHVRGAVSDHFGVELEIEPRVVDFRN